MLVSSCFAGPCLSWLVFSCLFLPPSSCLCCSHCCSSLLVPADLSVFVHSFLPAGLSLSLLVFFCLGWYLPIPACRFLSPLIPSCLCWYLPHVPTRIFPSLLVCTCPCLCLPAPTGPYLSLLSTSPYLSLSVLFGLFLSLFISALVCLSLPVPVGPHWSQPVFTHPSHPSCPCWSPNVQCVLFLSSAGQSHGLG